MSSGTKKHILAFSYLRLARLLSVTMDQPHAPPRHSSNDAKRPPFKQQGNHIFSPIRNTPCHNAHPPINTSCHHLDTEYASRHELAHHDKPPIHHPLPHHLLHHPPPHLPPNMGPTTLPLPRPHPRPQSHRLHKHVTRDLEQPTRAHPARPTQSPACAEPLVHKRSRLAGRDTPAIRA